jgi:hypothetical protein
MLRRFGLDPATNRWGLADSEDETPLAEVIERARSWLADNPQAGSAHLR